MLYAISASGGRVGSGSEGGHGAGCQPQVHAHGVRLSQVSVDELNKTILNLFMKFRLKTFFNSQTYKKT